MSEYDIRAFDTPPEDFGRVSLLAEKYSRPGIFTGNFLSSRLKSKVTSLRLGEICLVGTEFASMTEDIEGPEPVTAQYIDIPELGKGRHNSRTEVKFGQLLFETPSQGQKAALVAVKYTTETLAAREFGAMTAFNNSSLAREGDITFTPYGFARHPHTGKVGLISSYKHEVLTTDKILWNRDTSPSPRQIGAALSHAAVSAADLHNAGKAHGDLQPKNVSASNKGVWYTDLEGAQEFITARGLNTVLGASLIREDVDRYLVTRGAASEEMVEEYFARPYIELTQNGDLPSMMFPTFDEIMALSRQPQILNR